MKKVTKRVILITVSLICLIAAIPFLILSLKLTFLFLASIRIVPHLEIWDDFEKTTVESYPFVKHVSLSSYRSSKMQITYVLSREIDMEEIDELFIRTKNFILSEEVFERLKKYHLIKFRNYFYDIIIIFSYKDKEFKTLFECKITSPKDVDGEPYYNSFNTWNIEYDKEPRKLYNPGE